MSSAIRKSEEIGRFESLQDLSREPFRTWNETRTDYPRDKTVAQLFEEVAAEYPESVAVTFGCRQLTYRDLNARANRLAHRLRQLGVGPEVMVGCCLERSLELIVALVAVLKAGGAYVPLDPTYPKERFDFLLQDTHAPVMLTQRSVAATALAGRDLSCVHVDDESALAVGDDANPSPASGATNLAYVMYTSGSTGRPKGVMVENRAIVRLVRNTNFCRFGPEEVFLQFAPISFDAATLEVWGPLLNGGRLVVMPPHANSLEALGKIIREQKVTTLWLTAGLFHLMVEQRLEDLKSIRQLLAGGDVLSPRHVRLALENLPECNLINGYGPTENTTFTCCHSMRAGESVPDPIPIGRPISNTQIHILDQQMKPVPPGEAGELFAAGDGVARGYLNNPEATADKFAPDPFVPENGRRLYRTGDMARWREDGTVEFLGRIDNQVKILGYRIEPGEIESALGKHPGVSQLCVVPHVEESGAKRLVAYYVPASKEGATPQALREFLASKLPNYMIPALFVPLESLPLSANGKVDRSALPSPDTSAHNHSAEVAKSDLERTIANDWRRVLPSKNVGLDDNFFDLGGDSLLLVAVHSSLQKALGIEIAVTDLFEFTTVRALARHLEGKTPLRPVLSDAQERAKKQREFYARERQRRAGAL